MKKLSLSFLICSALPFSAFSHATFEEKTVPVNTTYKAVLRIPHGCHGSPTTQVRVKLPEGIIKAKPMPKAQWDIEVIQDTYANTYKYHGKTISKGPVEIIWKNGSLPSDFYDEFIFRARITDHFAVGETVHIPVIQTCKEGESAWVEIPAPGKDSHSVRRPAPTLTITEGHQHHQH